LPGGGRGRKNLKVGFILHLSSRGRFGGQNTLEKGRAGAKDGGGASFSYLPKFEDYSGFGRQYGGPEDEI
jgi:hypothetical protein